MRKLAGGSSSRRFAPLDDDDDDDDAPMSPKHQHLPANTTTTTCPKSPSSPSRGKRLLLSAACVAGKSPKRIPLDDDDDDETHESLQHKPTSFDSSKAEQLGYFPSLEYDTSSEEELGSFPSLQQQEERLQLSPVAEEEHDDSDSELHDLPTLQHEPPPEIRSAPPPSSEQHSVATSSRQQQLDRAIHNVIDNEQTRQATTIEEESTPEGLQMHPSYDDALVVFRPASSDAGGTDVSKASTSEIRIDLPTRSQQQLMSLPAKPVILKDDEQGGSSSQPTASNHNDGKSSSLPTGDSYDNIQSLIARVERLDAVVQASEEEEARSPTSAVKQAKTPTAFEQASRSTSEEETAARSTIERATRAAMKQTTRSTSVQQATRSAMEQTTRSTSVQQATRSAVKEEETVEMKLPDPPTNVSPQHSPSHNNPKRQRKSNDGDISNSNVEVGDDGAQDFQVLYRRGDGRESGGRDSPLSSQVQTSVATSSMLTISSFGIPGIQREVPVITPPTQKIRPKRQLTSHPFFWRTHPRETFTSYGKSHTKRVFSTLPGGKRREVATIQRCHYKRPNSMNRVEEVVEQKYDTRYRETGRSVSWSADNSDSVPNGLPHLLQGGTTGFSPYGEEASRVLTAPLSPTSSSRPSPSTSWVAFSEFSLGSVEQFERSESGVGSFM
jgi:hypothetical protein